MSIYHIIFIAALVSIAYSCAPLIGVHGQEIENKKLKVLRTQVSTQKNVQQVLGSPTTTSLEYNRLWLYMSRRTKAWLPTFTTEIKHRTVAIYFDPQGIIKKKFVLTAKNDRDINFVPETTPSPIAELNWIQRLFSNIGQVTPTGIPSN